MEAHRSEKTEVEDKQEMKRRAGDKWEVEARAEGEGKAGRVPLAHPFSLRFD